MKTVEIGATELAIAFWNVSGNDVTITGPNADIAAGALAFTDSAGNKLTTGTNFAVDGTAPVVTGTNATGNIARSGQTVRINGNAGFTVNGNPTVTIGGTGPGDLFSISAYNNEYVDILIGTASTAENTDPGIIVTDAAGNASNSNIILDIDNNVPTITNVATRYIKSGESSVITGVSAVFVCPEFIIPVGILIPYC